MTLAAAVVLVIAVTVVFTLFLREKDLPPPEPVSPVKHLEDRKAAIYENLRDLQFEYLVGKLSDVDYQQNKTGLQRELAGVMAEIDAVLGKSPKVAAAEKPVKVTEALTCPHCNTTFPKPMKFCGECGKAMVA